MIAPAASSVVVSAAPAIFGSILVVMLMTSVMMATTIVTVMFLEHWLLLCNERNVNSKKSGYLFGPESSAFALHLVCCFLKI